MIADFLKKTFPFRKRIQFPLRNNFVVPLLVIFPTTPIKKGAIEAISHLFITKLTLEMFS